MNSETLFRQALGLRSPWSVAQIRVEQTATHQRQLHLHVEFTKGSKFKDDAGLDCPVAGLWLGAKNRKINYETHDL